MTHITGRAIMSLCIALVAGGVAIKALSWPLKAGLFPLIVSIPVCCLAFVDFLLTIFEKGSSSEGSVDFKLELADLTFLVSLSHAAGSGIRF